MRRCLPIVALGLLALVSPLAGQSTISGVRDLAFGVVIRGVATTVSPDDPIRSGRFYVRHVLGRQVQLDFTLPAQLTRVGGGGTLAISFSKTDAVARETAPGSQPTYFDPSKKKKIKLNASADLFVNLGGRVSPTPTQATGSYIGTVILTCTFL